MSDGNSPPSSASRTHVEPKRQLLAEFEALLEELKHLASTTVLQPGCEIFKHGIIDDLAMYFVSGDLLSADFQRSRESIVGRPVGDLLLELVKMFDDSRYNVAYLTGCLVCVYRKITQQTQVAAHDPKARLLLVDFVRVVSEYLREPLDDAVWSEWFGDHAVTFDWFRFTASLFMPDGNFVAADECEQVIENVVEYFKNVDLGQYSCAFDA